MRDKVATNKGMFTHKKLSLKNNTKKCINLSNWQTAFYKKPKSKWSSNVWNSYLKKLKIYKAKIMIHGLLVALSSKKMVQLPGNLTANLFVRFSLMPSKNMWSA